MHCDWPRTAPTIPTCGDDTEGASFTPCPTPLDTVDAVHLSCGPVESATGDLPGGLSSAHVPPPPLDPLAQGAEPCGAPVTEREKDAEEVSGHRVPSFFLKLLGNPEVRNAHRPREPLLASAYSLVFSFLGLAAVSSIHYEALADHDQAMLIGSFGATAVLVFSAISSPLAQPYNVMVGHVISALIGVCIQKACSSLNFHRTWAPASIAVSVAIFAMALTKSLHPPGGATALIAVTGSQQLLDLGFMYVLSPVAAGAAIMLVVALVCNNLPSGRRYPQYWIP